MTNTHFSLKFAGWATGDYNHNPMSEMLGMQKNFCEIPRGLHSGCSAIAVSQGFFILAFSTPKQIDKSPAKIKIKCDDNRIISRLWNASASRIAMSG
jgi:hypothetical protein